MPDRISRVQRWLDLTSILVGRRFPVDVDQVMRNVPVYAQRWSGGSDTDRASEQRVGRPLAGRIWQLPGMSGLAEEIQE